MATPPNYVTLKQLQELRLKEKQDETGRRLCQPKEAAQEEKAAPGAAEVEEVRTRRNRPRGRRLPQAVPKQPSVKPEVEKARSQDRSRSAAGAPKQIHESRLKERQDEEEHRTRKLEEAHEGKAAKQQPKNYVTLKQLQELRLKEKQDEQNRQPRELKEIHQWKATEQRSPAVEVKEGRRNQPRDRRLFRAVPKQPPAKPEVEKARAQDRSHPAIEVTAGVPPNYVTLKQLQELRLKEKQDEEERRLKEAHEEGKATKMPVEVKEEVKDRELLVIVPKQPSTNHVAQKASSEEQSPPAVEVAVVNSETSHGPLRRGRRKTYNAKPNKQKETKLRMRSVWVLTVPPPETPVGHEKKVPEGIPSPEEGNKEVMGTGGAVIEQLVAETGVDYGNTNAETDKGKGRERGNSRKRTDGRRGRRAQTSDRNGDRRGRSSMAGGVQVWMRKAKPSEL